MTAWNDSDKTANIEVSSDGLTATSTAGSAEGIRATDVRVYGPWYCELTCLQGTTAGTSFGFANPDADLADIGPSTALCAVQLVTGGVFVNENFQFNNGVLEEGDVLCIAYEGDERKVWFRKNGGFWNNDSGANPETLTGGIDVSDIDDDGLFPAFGSSTTGDAVEANFGATPFAFDLPVGFTSWDGSITGTAPPPPPIQTVLLVS